MEGTALSNFTDFNRVTGPTYLTGADQLINEAVKHAYILGRILKGRGMDEVIQAGTKIKDDIMFDESSTYAHYKPNATFTWSNPQVVEELEVPWRFSVDHKSWTDQEVELNDPGGLTKSATKVAYKKLKRIKEQRMWTSMLNGVENDLWANAGGQTAEMETATGEKPYSIPAFITENTTYHARGWTNVMTQDPASQSKWRNQTEGYTYDAPDNSDTGLFAAFDTMFYKVRFKPPGTRDQYFTDPGLNKQMICCSRDGLNQYQRLLRDGNDSYISKEDPAYVAPAYGGIELVYVAALDTATLYADVLATPTAEYAEDSGSAASNGPRYWWINGNFIKPIFHARRYFTQHNPMRHPNQPFTTIQPVDCWWNLFCTSRQRHGMISPND